MGSNFSRSRQAPESTNTSSRRRSWRWLSRRSRRKENGPKAEAEPSLGASTMAIEWKAAARRATQNPDGLSGATALVEKNCNLLVAEQASRLALGPRLDPQKEAEDMTQEFLQQIIRCFPFPSPKPTPPGSPNKNRRRSEDVRTQDDSAMGIRNRTNRFRSLKVPGRKDNNAAQANAARVDAVIAHAHSDRNILKAMVMNSVDTMAITALPLDCWLRERLKHWCQLSGHAGTIVPATDSTLWKKRSGTDCNEATAYRALMDDVLCPFVPTFHKEVEYRGETFIEIDDLTSRFRDPAVMDVKMGTRTFLESEVKNPVKRSDLYLKMIRIDPEEPSEEEHADEALTKLRYMQFRERESSTAALGFRVEAIKVGKQELPGESLSRGFQKVRTREEVMALMLRFLSRRKGAREPLLERLKAIREKIPSSAFFQTHEVIGSSLLLMYDERQAGVWLIDFAKALPVEPPLCPLDHRRPWNLGNHEDGYLSGLDNLIQILEDSRHKDLHESP